MKNRATIVDYGLGNIHSVANALRFIGVDIEMAVDGSLINTATHLILPGVGAFSDGMEGLRTRGQDTAIASFVARSQGPLLGICLGAQLLMGQSDEFGRTSGLNIIPGRVQRVPSNGQKVPHVGWKQLSIPGHSNTQNLVADETWAYFVHSFHALPENPEHILATVNFGEDKVTAMIGDKLVTGCQFHPEKSGEPGLEMLRKFMNL